MFKRLYIFISIHSILAGLFIFFIPVFLWKLEFSLSQISLFISITGLSFCFTIYIWNKIKNINTIILISFIIELLLVTTGFFTDKSWFLYILAVIYGIYNCFFWLTQRILFLKEINNNNIGIKFGNIQIIAFILIKTGILIGAYILEYNNFLYLWLIILIINILGILIFYNKVKLNNKIGIKSNKTNKNPIRIKDILNFKDNNNSKIIFLLDGPFLFFESFFWIISLFLITNESYLQLGYLIILLTISFSIIFYIIKNNIDKIIFKYIYIISIILYALSWFLRGYIIQINDNIMIYIIVIFITFFTLFFRLTFNKNFFHITKNEGLEKYIIMKSYYSQASIFISFLFISFLFYKSQDIINIINNIYYILGFISLFYLVYRIK